MDTETLSGPWPDVAIPPGEMLADELEARQMTQAELARHMGRPAQMINEIIKEKKEITPQTALELERVLGTPAYVWLNLERDYRYNKERLADLERLEAQVARAREFPYAKMAALGWVPATRRPLERVRELLRYFAVSDLQLVTETQQAAYRMTGRREASPEALAVWLRKGEIEGGKVETKSFDATRLRQALPRMRQMTQLRPQDFHRPLCALCADCGVALVFIPHLPRTHANGAVCWLNPSTALVQLSVLRRYDDIFWFSLFHELGHLLLHGKREVFVELPEAPKTEKEEEADRFAADTLIPPRTLSRLQRMKPYSSANVQAFARTEGIAPSIVVGRLQHAGLLPHTHLNGLRTRLEIGAC
jgi:HTH-type transcriptional regulator/antitoxin HigA